MHLSSKQKGSRQSSRTSDPHYLNWLELVASPDSDGDAGGGENGGNCGFVAQLCAGRTFLHGCLFVSAAQWIRSTAVKNCAI